ncbi:hypothetical protein [Nostoc sp.]
MRVVDIINHLKQKFLQVQELVDELVDELLPALVLALALVPALMLALMLVLALALKQMLVRKRKRREISKGYIRWLAKVLPEDWHAELEALRHKWHKQRRPKFWIRLMTGIHVVDLLKAYVQIKMQNAKLFLKSTVKKSTVARRKN